LFLAAQDRINRDRVAKGTNKQQTIAVSASGQRIGVVDLDTFDLNYGKTESKYLATLAVAADDRERESEKCDQRPKFEKRRNLPTYLRGAARNLRRLQPLLKHSRYY
jgi:hypothetical protein